MKADQTLSAIFRQLRPSPLRASLHPSYNRPLCQAAAFDHPISSKSQLFSTRSRRLTALSRYHSHSIRNSQRSSSTSAAPSSSPTAQSYSSSATPERPPAYELTFTCKPCLHRSTHNVSKQGYHHGTVLITCPDCKNRHVISDHLKIFADTAFTVEDLMRQKGDLVKRGTLEGDVEFWDDGAEVTRDSKERKILKLAKMESAEDSRKRSGDKSRA